MADACRLPGFERSTRYGLFAPPRLPEPIVTRLAFEVVTIIGAPEFRRWLIDAHGLAPVVDPSPEAFRRVPVRDLERWAAVVAKSGARVD